MQPKGAVPLGKGLARTLLLVFYVICEAIIVGHVLNTVAIRELDIGCYYKLTWLVWR